MGDRDCNGLGSGDGLCDRALSNMDLPPLGVVFFLRKGFDIEIDLLCDGLALL